MLTLGYQQMNGVINCVYAVKRSMYAAFDRTKLLNIFAFDEKRIQKI